MSDVRRKVVPDKVRLNRERLVAMKCYLNVSMPPATVQPVKARVFARPCKRPRYQKSFLEVLSIVSLSRRFSMWLNS